MVHVTLGDDTELLDAQVRGTGERLEIDQSFRWYITLLFGDNWGPRHRFCCRRSGWTFCDLLAGEAPTIYLKNAFPCDG